MSEVKGITQTLEALDALEVVVTELKKVLADGKLSLADAGVVFSLLNKFTVINKGVSGAGEIVAEIKDLSSDELNVLAQRALKLGMIVKG